MSEAAISVNSGYSCFFEKRRNIKEYLFPFLWVPISEGEIFLRLSAFYDPGIVIYFGRFALRAIGVQACVDLEITPEGVRRRKSEMLSHLVICLLRMLLHVGLDLRQTIFDDEILHRIAGLNLNRCRELTRIQSESIGYNTSATALTMADAVKVSSFPGLYPNIFSNVTEGW